MGFSPLNDLKTASNEGAERFSQVIHQMPYPVEVCAPDGTAVMVNQAFLRMFGVASADRVVGSYNVFQDPLIETLGLSDAVSRVYAGERVVVQEIVVPLALVKEHYGGTREGAVVQEVTMFPVFDPSGDIWRVVTLWKDITDRRQAEDARDRSGTLLLALSRVAQEILRARTPEAAYTAIAEQLDSLGLEAIVLRVDAGRTHVSLSDLTPTSSRIRAVGERLGLSREDYRMPLVPGSVYWRVVNSGETVLRAVNADYIAGDLPARLRPLASQLMAQLGWQRNVFAPLTINGVIEGILVIIGADLTEADLPACTCFADHVSIAIENARLHERTQRLAAFASDIVQGMAEGILVEDAAGIFTFVNPAAAAALGYPDGELVGQSWRTVVPPDQRHIVDEISAERPRGQSSRYELDLIRKDGGRIAVRVSGTPRFDKAGGFTGTTAIFTDITEHLEGELRYAQILRTATEGFWFVGAGGKLLEVNPAAAAMLGYTMEEMVGMTIADIDVNEDTEEVERHCRRVQVQGEEIFEAQHRHKDGRIIEVEVSVSHLAMENGRLVGFIRDITARKRAEAERAITLRFLGLLNTSNDLHALMDSVTGLMYEWSGCEAVGIRLRQGEDYPYFETRGFPAAFVQLESLLCARDLEGQLLRDEQGNAMLECMCGNVICERFDPSLPFFTEQGSFWSNGTTQLLASTNEQERQARTRNRCNGEGYESVALIPVRHGAETLGLLQFNDTRPDRFDEDQIALFERLAANLALGLVQRRAAQALAESEEKYRALFENAPVGIFRTDSQGRALLTNSVMARMLGFSSPEAAMHDSQRLGGHLYINAERRSAFLRLLSERGYVEDFDYEARSITGQVISLSTSARVTYTSPDGSFGIEGFSVDVTERKRLTTQLREQARKLRQILVTVPAGVLLLDARGRVLQANPLAEKALAELQAGEAGDRVTRLGDRTLAELLASSSSKGLWHEIKSEGRIFEANAQPIEKTGLPENWVLILRDVTEERRIEWQTQQQDRLAAVGQLAAGIAHDFNNLMAVILLYTRMVLDRCALPEVARERLSIVAEQAKQATALTQQILDFSRRSVLERRPMDLVPFLDEVVVLLRRTLPESLHLSLTYGKDEYTANADPTRMQQALLNLVLNARDAMPQGGDLYLDLRRVTMGKGTSCLGCGQTLHGDWICITVRDTGTGIAPEMLAHIFEPFYTTKAAGQGTGLGLAQVYGIVKQHEGHIDVFTKVGEGTTFAIYLPVLLKPSPVELEEETMPMVSGHGETILLVEDDAPLRRALIETLMVLGYRVREAAHGREALEILAQPAQPIALVLSDLVMPEMGGQALFSAMRQRGFTMPVVMLTGHPLTHELAGLEGEGLAGWMLKPPDMVRLSQLLARVLEAGDASEVSGSG